MENSKKGFVSIRKKFFRYCVWLVLCLFLIICISLAAMIYCDRSSDRVLENYEVFSLFWNDLEDLDNLLYSHMQTPGVQTEKGVRERLSSLMSGAEKLKYEILDPRIEDLFILTSGLEENGTLFLEMDAEKESVRVDQYSCGNRYRMELESLKRNFYDALENYMIKRRSRMKEVQMMIWAGLLAGGGIIFACFVRYTGKITRHILNPVSNLTQQFQKIISGDTEIRLNYLEREADELDILNNVFYRMVETNNRSMQELQNKAELERNLAHTQVSNANLRARLDRTKLRLLQSRVSPHFMFNTFNILAGLAIAEGAERTRQFAVKTAKYFRYSLVSLDKTVRLREEIENVRLYLEIQKARFGERLLTELTVSEECEDILVPAMILQPFCENAIIHGMGIESRPFRIRITASKKETMFQITVEDDGAGMNTERLASVKESLLEWDEYDDSDGIGVKNTFQRLQMYYEGQARCLIESTPGEGTRVELWVPVR